MGLLSPTLLLLLALLPAFVAVYVWVLRRQKRFAVHYSSISLIRQARPGGLRWRRHLPFALFLLALLSLVVTLARPVASFTVPSSRATVVLALDVSLSMCASDIEPNRLTAAQEAAETFIRNQEPGTQVAIVAFAGLAELVVPPTADKAVLIDTVGDLGTAWGTAVGSAILRSLGAISEVNDEVAPVGVFTARRQTGPDSGIETVTQPEIVVLLTDGASNRGVRPLNAAQAAVDRGIRVYTIGFGTPRGLPFACTERQMRGIGFGRGFIPGRFGGGAGGFGGGFSLALDERTLQQVADMTGGEYFLAESADELLDVFSNVRARVVPTEVTTEISAVFASIGALLALAAVALGLRWNPLP